VPDDNGFVKIKELIQVFSQDKNLPCIRPQTFNEILLNIKNSQIEIQHNSIRAKNRETLPNFIKDFAPPKLLYICVRNRSLNHILERGISASNNKVILCANIDQAVMIGKRKDNKPELLIINTEYAIQNGATFYKFGNSIYIADFISPEALINPTIPKEKKQASKNTADKKTPGSFVLKVEKNPEKNKNSSGSKKSVSWKRNKKRLRREKNRFSF
jgi:putative RNA 2'-phosphotransferase